MRTTKRYGWIPSLPDKRDLLLERPSRFLAERLPESIDLTPRLGRVYDQGQIGSCTANATAGAILFENKRLTGIEGVLPSRLFMYYTSRELEGSTASDSGAELRDVFKALSKAGVCPERMFGYEHSFQDRPWPQCYAAGLKDVAITYLSVAQELNHMKACLAAGFPMVVGFTVYDSFESDEVAASGVVPMPDLENESVVGGHAVLCCGYDDATERFTCRNSWGSDWGMKGNFTIPYAYLTDPDLAGDFWTLRKMEA